MKEKYISLTSSKILSLGNTKEKQAFLWYFARLIVSLCHISVEKYGKLSVGTAHLPYYGGCSGNDGYHYRVGVFYSQKVYAKRG